MPTFQGATAANAGYVAGGVSQEMEQAGAHFRAPDVPGFDKLLKHPLALVSFVPRELALFFAGAVAGAAAKTVTAPLDRVKLLMQASKQIGIVSDFVSCTDSTYAMPVKGNYIA